MSDRHGLLTIVQPRYLYYLLIDTQTSHLDAPIEATKAMQSSDSKHKEAGSSDEMIKGDHLGRVTARAGGVILSHVEQHTDSLLHGQLTGGAA